MIEPIPIFCNNQQLTVVPAEWGEFAVGHVFVGSYKEKYTISAKISNDENVLAFLAIPEAA